MFYTNKYNRKKYLLKYLSVSYMGPIKKLVCFFRWFAERFGMHGSWCRVTEIFRVRLLNVFAMQDSTTPIPKNTKKSVI
jgi:hypothetical protein